MGSERWVYDFAEGSRDMRDLLGGKGANVAEMTRVLGTEHVPAGFTITTEASVAYTRSGEEPDGLEDQVAAALGRLQELAGKRFGDDAGPAAGVGPQRRPRIDAGDARHDPQPGAQRQLRRGARRRDRERAVRVGLLSAARADVRERRSRSPGRAVRGRDRGGQESGRGRDRCRAAGRRRSRSWSAFKRFYDFPQDPTSSCAERSGRYSTPGRASAPSPTGGSTGFPTTGARPSTSSRWCLATRGRRRRPGSRSAATRYRRAGALRGLPDQRPGRGRRLRGAHAA